MSEIIDIILKSSYLVVLGGAGVSTASGIPDFRSATGLYNKQQHLKPEEILSHHFFIKHPDLFYEFYKNNLIYENAQPSSCHQALSMLEKKGICKAIITQNIDGLHQKAGSENVLELHGSIYRNHCQKCQRFYPLDSIRKTKGVSKCSCGGIIKPDVVLYEEAIDDAILRQSINHLKQADTLVIVGTSLNVYPAASLINFFRGKNLILINKDKTPYDSLATHVFHDDLNIIFSKIKECLDDKI